MALKKRADGTEIKVGDPDYVAPSPEEEAAERARYEADAAKAEVARLKREADELKKQLPSDEQRAKWAEMEAREAKAEEDRMKKAGEFDAWRQSIVEKSQRDLDAQIQLVKNEAAAREATERELNDTLIATEFANAVELFGPTGKTVYIPAVAQAFFKPHVEVEVIPNPTGGPSRRRVIVKDAHGTTILDPKTGAPMAFVKAMNEIIDNHPQKDYMLRGSNKVGSGSPGGANGNAGQELDLGRRYTAQELRDPNTQRQMRERFANSGTIQVGPGFDRIKHAVTKK